jgi:hypothetical protein
MHLAETPWPLVRKRNTQSKQPLVGEVNIIFCQWRVVAWSAQRVSKSVHLGFPDRHLADEGRNSEKFCSNLKM